MNISMLKFETSIWGTTLKEKDKPKIKVIHGQPYFYKCLESDIYATIIYHLISIIKNTKKSSVNIKFLKGPGNCKILNPTEETVIDTNLLKRNLVILSKVVDFIPCDQVILFLESTKSCLREEGLVKE